MVTALDRSGPNYDPYDPEIDDDPYPVWRRLRDEAPLYRNAQHDFFALSRWEDVEPALRDWEAFRSGKGTTLEVIRAVVDNGIELPPGIVLFEDPPIHDLHRSLLSRVFTPRRMATIEPLVRRYCATALDPLVGEDEFDLVADFAAFVPMRTIGFLLGIPEGSQEEIRRRTDERLAIVDGAPSDIDDTTFEVTDDVLSDYIDWRARHPSDDLMTDLLQAEIDDGGTRRRLTRDEVVTYTRVVAGAGNETATRLIGFTVDLLERHPDQRREVHDDRGLVDRCIEEVLRYEAPSPVQARYVAHDVDVLGTTIHAGSVVLLLNGAANRDERHFPDAERFDIHRDDGPHLSFGYGLHYCLGAALARLEGRVALDEILRRWPAWTVDRERGRKAHTASVRGWETLPFQPT